MSAATMIGDQSEAELLKFVEREIKKKNKTSELFTDDQANLITKFDLSELTIGEELGRGGFCVVKAVSKITLAAQEKAVEAKNLGFWGGRSGNGDSNGRGGQEEKSSDERKSLALNYLQKGPNGDDFRYVIKVVQASAREDAEFFVRSIMDLALEAQYLAVLEHPNIVDMRAVAATSPYKEGCTFFVMLDKLDDILSLRLETWRKQLPSSLFSCCFHAEEPKELWNERLMTAYDISKALTYIHSKNILYRDIKPDNVGYLDGAVKIFDFGLAREMQKKLKTVEGTFQLTASTGFFPYMAPEVAQGRPYNQTADVYSFCILLWQLMKVSAPFDHSFTEKEYMSKVVRGGLRPQPSNHWPDEIVDFMKLGWSEDISARPSMSQISNILHQQIYDSKGRPESESLIQIA